MRCGRLAKNIVQGNTSACFCRQTVKRELLIGIKELSTLCGNGWCARWQCQLGFWDLTLWVALHLLWAWVVHPVTWYHKRRLLLYLIFIYILIPLKNFRKNHFLNGSHQGPQWNRQVLHFRTKFRKHTIWLTWGRSFVDMRVSWGNIPQISVLGLLRNLRNWREVNTT